MEVINYSQTIDNSHFWSDLKQIIYYIELAGDEKVVTPLKEFIITGLKNTLTEGYELKQLHPRFFRRTPYFLNIPLMIMFVENFYNSEQFITNITNTINNGINLKKKEIDKMERVEVYKKLDTERDYQDLRWSVRREDNGTPDEEKPPSEWINYMEYHLSKAKEAVYLLKNEEAMAEIRKVSALGIRAMELHGCPDRIIPKSLLKSDDHE